MIRLTLLMSVLLTACVPTPAPLIDRVFTTIITDTGSINIGWDVDCHDGEYVTADDLRGYDEYSELVDLANDLQSQAINHLNQQIMEISFLHCDQEI